MYAHRSRRTKTDKRDARTLMDACETGAWRPAYRHAEARRHVRAELAARDALVRTRTRYLAQAKALVRRDALRVRRRRVDSISISRGRAWRRSCAHARRSNRWPFAFNGAPGTFSRT